MAHPRLVVGMSKDRLFVSLLGKGGCVPSSRGGGAEALAVGPGEGAVAAPARAEAGIGGAHAAVHQLPGKPQPSFDKQYVRDWLETLDWNKQYPGPELPEEVIANTIKCYSTALETLMGK